MSSFSDLSFGGVEADRAAQLTRSVFRYLTPPGPGELHGRSALWVSPLLAHGFR